MTSKVCSKCKGEKPLEAFNKNRSTKDGLQGSCKVCDNWYSKQYYQKNREKRLEWCKQRYQENREQKLEYNKQWRQEHPEKVKSRRAKYKALKKGNIPEALLDCPIEKDRLEETYKLRSLLSKATGVEYHVDHIWPLSKGGPHWSGNLQVITAEENISKSDSFCEDTAKVIQESLDDYIQSIRH